MNEKSYTEMMKASAMNRKNTKEAFVMGLYIDMLLSEVLLKAEKEKLAAQIDQAIDARDKQTFILLSQQLNDVTKRFGT